MPASSATLAARAVQDVGYVLFFEGLRVAYTNRRELAGEGGGSWIGTSEGDRIVLTGLEPPDAIKHSISLEAGLIADNDVSFTIVDSAQQIIGLFDAGLENTDAEPLQVYERLGPLDDPAPANLIGKDGEAVGVWGKYINGESIGPAGERRQFQVLPGTAGQLPGYDHAAVDSTEQALAPSQVTSTPRWFEGRRMSLYLIRRDPHTGEWVTWLDAEQSGYGRIWWGTARNARVTARAWTFNCEGPGSWLRGTLNRLRPTVWQETAGGGLAISEAQGYCGIALSHIKYTLEERVRCAYSLFDAPDLVVLPGMSPGDVRDALHARLQAIVVAAGEDTYSFATFHEGEAAIVSAITDNGEPSTKIRIRVADAPGIENEHGGEMWLVLHEKVWRWLGFDPILQDQQLSQISSEYEIPFYHYSAGEVFKPGLALEPIWAAVGVEVPTDDYYAARITTLPVGTPSFVSEDADGDGVMREHRAVNREGVVLLEEGTKLYMGIGTALPYVGGQTMRPVDDAQVGGQDCDTTGFIALRGSYLPKGADEARTITTIWKCSWKNAGGMFGEENSVATVYLSRQLDPRLFGVTNGKAPPAWALTDLQWVSVAIFGHDLSGPDRAHAVLVRLLLGTGTATWDGFEGDPGTTITNGENAHPDAPDDYLGNDREVADLCFGVPAEMVDWKSFYDVAALTPGGYEGELNACRIGRIGPVDGGELLKSLLAPRGWALGLQGGKYTLFRKAGLLDVADSVASLTQADLDSRDVPFIEPVDMYPLSPLDKLTCTYGQDPIAGAGSTRQFIGQARDPGSWRRANGGSKDVDGSTLLPNYGSNLSNPLPPWHSDFREVWEQDLAAFFATPHITIEIPVRVDKARDIWPGSIVRVGSPWPANREGSYGLAGRVGLVLATTQDLREALTKRVKILVRPGDPLSSRRFAPIAAVLDVVDTLEERHDAAARTFYCYADAFEHGDNSIDVAGFEEPDWLAVGGDAKCIGWQHDGREWSQTFGFTLESVSIAGNSLTYKPGTLTGKFWERRWTYIVMAPYDDQDDGSWPRALFGVITKPNGEFGAGPTKGWKFKTVGP